MTDKTVLLEFEKHIPRCYEERFISVEDALYYEGNTVKISFEPSSPLTPLFAGNYRENLKLRIYVVLFGFNIIVFEEISNFH